MVFGQCQTVGGGEFAGEKRNFWGSGRRRCCGSGRVFLVSRGSSGGLPHGSPLVNLALFAESPQFRHPDRQSRKCRATPCRNAVATPVKTASRRRLDTVTQASHDAPAGEGGRGCLWGCFCGASAERQRRSRDGRHVGGPAKPGRDGKPKAKLCHSKPCHCGGCRPRTPAFAGG